MSQYKAIITDVDGTLYHQTPLRINMGLLMLIKAPGTVISMLRFRKEREQGKLVEPDERVREWMYVKPLRYLKRYKNNMVLAFLDKARNEGLKLLHIPIIRQRRNWTPWKLNAIRSMILQEKDGLCAKKMSVEYVIV